MVERETGRVGGKRHRLTAREISNMAIGQTWHWWRMGSTVCMCGAAIVQKRSVTQPQLMKINQ